MFARHERDNLARVSDVLLAICRAMRMSPWAAKKQWEAVARERAFDGYSMQPAAGQRAVVDDKVLMGSVDRPAERPVELEGRPIFTIERVTR